YHINQSSLVDSIQYLRQLNFSLEDIKEILSDKDHFQLHQLIEERYQRLLEEKENLEKQIQEIEIFRSGARIYGEKQSEQELEIQTFPERQLLT
ncbi:MerR family DNA-binding protein, partial [Streptococcus salivarius]